VSVQDFPRLHLESLKIPNFDIYADPEFRIGSVIATDSEVASSAQPVLWIRIGFNADPDLALISMRIQADPDPDPDQTFNSQKVRFLNEIYTESG
jgi:hypothetical protein